MAWIVALGAILPAASLALSVPALALSEIGQEEQPAHLQHRQVPHPTEELLHLHQEQEDLPNCSLDRNSLGDAVHHVRLHTN